MGVFFKPFSSVIKDYAVWATQPQPRIPTGFTFFDSRTGGGAAAGEVILFQARSSVGKTTVANNIVVNNPGLPVAFMSLEMHGRYIANRIAAIYGGTTTRQIEYDLQTGGYSEALVNAVDAFPKLAVFDKPAMSLKDMGLAIDEAEDVFDDKIQLVIIDFMELIGGVPSLSAVEKVDQVARKVKDFAREKDVVVLVLHQVGRGEGGAGHEPLSLTAGRYGGEISADYVLSAYRPCLRPGITQEQYETEKWQIYLQFLKSRSGSELHPAGLLHQINPGTMKIGPWSYETEPLFPDYVEDEPPAHEAWAAEAERRLVEEGGSLLTLPGEVPV